MDRNKLISVYTLWVSRFRNQPEQYSEEGSVQEVAERCADHFIELLAEVEAA